MGYLDRLMNQTATYWKPATSNRFDQFGDPSFTAGSPTLLLPEENNGVRWENITKKFINSQGQDEQSRAIIWSATTEFQVGGYLYNGRSSTANPENVDGADQIKYIEKCPDVGGVTFLYKAIL